MPPSQPLLKKNTKFEWNDDLESHFQHFKNQVASATENTQFNPYLESRIQCDTSCTDLVAALERHSQRGYEKITLAPSFLSSN